MRLLVTGSRAWDDAGYIRRVLDGVYAGLGDREVLVLHHGACPQGADAIADLWARWGQAASRRILVVRHPAAWRTTAGGVDRGAGMRRNADMVTEIGAGGNVACHAFIRDRSRGASQCARLAEKAGIPTVRHLWEDR